MAWLDGAVNGMVSRLVPAGFTPGEAFCLAQAAYIKERKRAEGVPRSVLERQQVSLEINQALKRLGSFPMGPEAHRQRIILWEKVFGRGSWHEPIDPEEIYGRDRGEPARSIVDSLRLQKIADDAAFSKLHYVAPDLAEPPLPLENLKRGFRVMAGGNSLFCSFEVQGNAKHCDGLVACTGDKVGLFTMQSLASSGDPVPGDRIMEFSSVEYVAYARIPGAVTIHDLQHFTAVDVPHPSHPVMKIGFDSGDVWDLQFSTEQMGGYGSTPYVNFVKGFHDDYQQWHAATILNSVPTSDAAEKPAAVGSMNTARTDHTATLLPEGTVLVAGGQGENSLSTLSSSELYNPTTGLWHHAPDMTVARKQHSATLLPNGTVLVTGGVTKFAGHDLATAELYDPSARTWSMTGSMVSGASRHSATLMPDGKVLVRGRFTAELYDPLTGSWSLTGDVPTYRSSHTATLLENGTVLVTGGFEEIYYDDDFLAGSNTTYSAETYDPGTGSWSRTGSMAQSRQLHTATLLSNGTVLVTGGLEGYLLEEALATAEIYDPITGTWSMTRFMAFARYGHSATLMPDGTVLVVGGTTTETLGRPGSDDGAGSAELFDPVKGTWSAQTGGNVRVGHTATLLRDGTVLMAGGTMDEDARRPVTSVFVYR